jgi:organic radical activating enzyme
MAYRVVDGMVISDLVELNVVDQCNLSCRSCSHQSPISRNRFLQPGTIERDLRRLSACYRAGTLRLLGGEPLLHPRLAEILHAARASGIARDVRLVTNGILLPRADETLWEALSTVEISSYPGRSLDEDGRRRVLAAARRWNVRIVGRTYRHFRESYSLHACADPELVTRVYRTCQIAHVWGCHNVHEGHFYMCPQAHVLARGQRPPSGDGIPLVGPELGSRLVAYLTSAQPLTGCARCLGSVGRLFEHEYLPRRNWEAPQDRPIEDLVDWERLHHLETVDSDADDICNGGEQTLSSGDP